MQEKNDENRENRWRDFESAREFARGLGLKGEGKWHEYLKSGNRPKDIPSHPAQVYKSKWRGWGDWLGTWNVATQNRTYRSFEEAREFVRGLGLKSRSEWREYCESGQRPDDIPSCPDSHYKSEWKGMGDWLGTERIASQDRTFRPFHAAREFVQSIGIKNKDEWNTYYKSKQMPDDIPSNPPRTYKSEWRGWGDWFGTGSVHPRDKVFRSFEEAREFVRGLGLRGQREWYQYRESGQRPDDIPSCPDSHYKSEWKGMGDWLGTGSIHPKYMVFRSFEEAREFARRLGLKGQREWQEYSKSSGQRPDDIPGNPRQPYKDKWRGWGDFLGYAYWTNLALLAFLEDLRPILASLEERELYTILQQGGKLKKFKFAMNATSDLSIIKDLKENEGKGVEAALKGISEEELEACEEETGNPLLDEEQGQKSPMKCHPLKRMSYHSQNSQ